MTQKTEQKARVFPVATAIRLEETVQYAGDSVVSKTITRNSAGNMTLFAFDKGQGLSEHSAPFDAFVQILDGRATLTIGGKQVQVKTGDTVLMPADIKHAVMATERFKMLLIMIKGVPGEA